MKRSRGGALVTVILGLTITLTVLFLLGQVATQHLGFVASLEARQQARNLAEAAVARGLAEILESESYGVSRPRGRRIVVRGSELWGGGEGEGTLTFSPAEDRQYFSTNNLTRTTSVPGSGRSVPKGVAHLVGVGRYAGATRVVEALYYRPPFPFGASASGPIIAPEGLSVVGLAAGADLTGEPGEISSSARAASSLRSTSGGDPAIRLGPGCQVLGDLSAPGVVRVDPGATVSGEVRSGDSPGRLPVVDVETLMASLESVSGAAGVSGQVGSLSVNWVTGCSEDLTVLGDLTLQQGVLYVRGDLEVRGAVQGDGLVLVGGRTSLLGGAELRAQNMVAVGSVGDVAMTAQGSAGYFFQGLVYSGGNLEAREITVLGSLITNAPAGSGQMTLENMTLVQDARTAYAVFPIPEQAFEYDPPRDPPADDVYHHPTWVSVWPEVGPDGPTGQTLVRIVVPAPAAKRFDQQWKVPGEITIAELKRQYGPRILHDDAWKKTLDRMVAAQVSSRRNPYVIQMDTNSLLTPSERARVLLWKDVV